MLMLMRSVGGLSHDAESSDHRWASDEIIRNKTVDIKFLK